MPTAVSLDSFKTFGSLLHYLRRRARLTQRELAIEVGYSEAHVSRLESDQRLPDLTSLVALFVPALDLDEDPLAVARLMELAAAARGEKLDGATVSLTRTTEHRLTSTIGVIEAPPQLPAAYVERQALERVRDHWQRERCLVLCGLAGVGKTTLAAALAQATGTPTFWLSFTAGITASVDVVVRQLALFLVGLGDETLLGMAEAPATQDGEAAPPLDQQLGLLIAALGRNPAMLCFDNAHLIAQDEAICRVLGHLAASATASMLLISRERLTLPGSGTATLGGLNPDEAAALLDLLDARLDARQRDQLIERTAGNPTLLRLAVGQLAELGDGAALLKHLATEPHVADYIVQNTTQRLTPAGQRLLDLLAVLLQPANLYDERLVELVQAADGPYDWTGALAELTRRQLIDRPIHAALPPLVSEHIYAALVGDSDRRRNLHRVAAEWLEGSGGHPVQAAHHYARANQPQAALTVLSDQINVVLGRGESAAAAAVVDELLAGARHPRVGPASPELLAPLLSLRGDLLVSTLRASEAETNYREALALTSQPTVRAHLVWRMSGSLLQRGHVAEALTLIEQAEAALTPRDTLLQAHLASAASKALLMMSRFAEAEARANKAIGLANRLDGALAVIAVGIRVRSAAVIAIVMQLTQRFAEALAQWREVIPAAGAVGLERYRPRYLLNMANVLFDQGDLPGSFAAMNDGLAAARRIGDTFALGRLLHAIGLLHYIRAEWDEALAYLEESCELKRAMGDIPGLYNSLNQRALVLAGLGRVTEACASIEDTLARAGEAYEPRARCIYLDTLALCQILAGDFEAAQASIDAGLALPVVRADGRIAAFLTNHQALVLALRGDPAAGAALIEEPALMLEIDLERGLTRGLIALIRGDRAAARASAEAAGERAAANHYIMYARAAARIAATALAAAPLARGDLPALLWQHPALAGGSWDGAENGEEALLVGAARSPRTA